MPTKIRLQRKGKKGQPFYHLVVADGRAPRDGKFIERLGTYNPLTHPATIEINFDRSLYWIQVGAQPTDTARYILSSKGVMLKHHLLKGVKKGALTEEQVEEKFQEWLKEKQEKLEKIRKDAEMSDKDKGKKQLEAERKINETRADEISKKRAQENLKIEGEAEAQKDEAVAKEEAKEAAKEEQPKAEEKAEAAPAKEEKPEKEEEAKKEEQPKAEEKAEAAPAKEEKPEKEEEAKKEDKPEKADPKGE